MTPESTPVIFRHAHDYQHYDPGVCAAPVESSADYGIGV